MLIHREAARFFKISRDISNPERRGYYQCTSQIVRNRVIYIMPNLEKKVFPENLEISWAIVIK
ncbi:hypothetical protein T11_7336 [Trichinella zimbabwensis]|uniref:Uncharacterized protein n=1 Tax=Trichinella zimbabwensis TaxID=268475 RepID=A0A0V1GS45_9BILA|nr:hypothetical protein T11_7336 [Trichinella zimbabwensis]